MALLLNARSEGLHKTSSASYSPLAVVKLDTKGPFARSPTNTSDAASSTTPMKATVMAALAVATQLAKLHGSSSATPGEAFLEWVEAAASLVLVGDRAKGPLVSSLTTANGE